MSRHSIPTLHPHHDVVVGWDPPLRTFFAQVFDRNIEDEDDQIVMWVGADPGVFIDEPETIRAAVRQYAVIYPAMMTLLRADKAHNN
jgi:hypothetical protein